MYQTHFDLCWFYKRKIKEKMNFNVRHGNTFDEIAVDFTTNDYNFDKHLKQHVLRKYSHFTELSTIKTHEFTCI